MEQLRARCLLCGAELLLSHDSEQARVAQIDPRQQMRRHLITHGFIRLAAFAKEAGWIIDMLAFEFLQNPEAWERNFKALVVHFREETKKAG